jgi:SAM-dependent methyltransferase
MKTTSPATWPKRLPDLTSEQQAIRDDFMAYWHEVLPRRYGLVERFNHRYPLSDRPAKTGCRTLEIGAGLGEHLAYERLTDQDYYCIELRAAMAQQIAKRFPGVTTVTGDCQQHLDFADGFFDRILAIHVLEHLPDLPSALGEVRRVLAKDGVFSVVIPCDPGLAYGLARRISAQRIFERRYKQSYDWFIRSEHINGPREIMDELVRGFTVVRQRYFPLFVPAIPLNLCIGLTLKPTP